MQVHAWHTYSWNNVDSLEKKKTLNILKASHWIILGNSSNDVDSTLQKRRRIDVESVSNFRRDDDAINVKKIALLSQSTSPTISTANRRRNDIIPKTRLIRRPLYTRKCTNPYAIQTPAPELK